MIEKLVKEQPNNADTGLPLGDQSSQWFASIKYIIGFGKKQKNIRGAFVYENDIK